MTMNGETQRLPYYPGCTLKTTAANFEVSALASARVLGMELVEIPRWNCCGTVFSLTDDDLIHHVAPVRNLIRVQEMNREGEVADEHRLVTLCSMCFNTLKRANLRMHENPDNLKTLNDFMNLEEDYEGGVEVVHLLELLRDMGTGAIADKVERPLTGLRVAPYYGCMLLKPKEVGIDDPEEPTIQSDIIRALGAEVVYNHYMKVCCGSYQTMHSKEAVAGLAYDILSHAQADGAQAIATSCPLCAYNLDNRQKQVKEIHPEFKEIPVLYFTQLMAVAFGLDKAACGLEQNYVSAVDLLQQTQLLPQ
jgi:heterodisulfide reductase subunit B